MDAAVEPVGDEEFTIQPREAVEFPTWTPRWFDGPVELIMIVGPHGELVT